MKNFIWLCLLVSLVFLFGSCTKETSLTEGQLTAQQLETAFNLQANVMNSNINVTVLNLDNGSLLFSGTQLIINSNGFITVSSTSVSNNTSVTNSITLNLALLKSYQSVYGNNLYLYF